MTEETKKKIDDFVKTFGTEDGMIGAKHGCEFGYSIAESRINDLENGVYEFIAWMKKHRSSIPGLGGPLSILHSIMTKDGYSLASQEHREEWVRVEERLPDTTHDVLVWCEGWDVPIQAYYFKAHNVWHGSREVRDSMKDGYCSNGELFEPPTHWMPLPTPPTK